MKGLEVALERLRLSQPTRAAWTHGFVSTRALVAALSWGMGNKHDAVHASTAVT